MKLIDFNKMFFARSFFASIYFIVLAGVILSVVCATFWLHSELEVLDSMKAYLKTNLCEMKEEIERYACLYDEIEALKAEKKSTRHLDKPYSEAKNKLYDKSIEIFTEFVRLDYFNDVNDVNLAVTLARMPLKFGNGWYTLVYEACKEKDSKYDEIVENLDSYRKNRKNAWHSYWLMLAKTMIGSYFFLVAVDIVNALVIGAVNMKKLYEKFNNVEINVE